MRRLQIFATSLALLAAMAAPAWAVLPTPLACYKLDEASSGNAPSSAADCETSPVNLAITVGSGGSAWMSDGAGKGYTFVTTSTQSIFKSASLGGSKIATTLAAATQATVIFKRNRVSDLAGNQAWFAITTAADRSAFEVYDNGNIWWGNENTGKATGITGAGHVGSMDVVAVVIDTTQATSTNRCLVYVNGTLTDSLGGSTLNRTIDAADAFTLQFLSIGNIPAVTASPDGTVKATMLYSTAVSAADVASISTLLASNDDTEPLSAGSTTFPGTGFFWLKSPGWYRKDGFGW